MKFHPHRMLSLIGVLSYLLAFGCQQLPVERPEVSAAKQEPESAAEPLRLDHSHLSWLPIMNGTTEWAYGSLGGYGAPREGQPIKLDFGRKSRLTMFPLNDGGFVYVPLPESFQVKEIYWYTNGGFKEVRLQSTNGYTTVTMDITPLGSLEGRAVRVWILYESPLLSSAALLALTHDEDFPTREEYETLQKDSTP